MWGVLLLLLAAEWVRLAAAEFVDLLLQIGLESIELDLELSQLGIDLILQVRIAGGDAGGLQDFGQRLLVHSRTDIDCSLSLLRWLLLLLGLLRWLLLLLRLPLLLLWLLLLGLLLPLLLWLLRITHKSFLFLL